MFLDDIRPEMFSHPQYAKIALEAYRIWEREGRPEGRCQDYWRIAEDLVQRSEQNPTQQLANANLNMNIAMALMQ